MTRYLQTIIQSKGIIKDGSPEEDFRSFLQFADPDEMMVYEIRGYGVTPGAAADDAWAKFLDDPWWYAEDSWEWK